MAQGGRWVWFLPLFTFMALPLIEQTGPGSEANLDDEAEADALADRFHDLLLYAVVPLQYALLGTFLWRLHVGGLSTAQTVGAVFTMGIACSVYGINVAHELGHRRSRFEQALSKSLLLTSLYLHFFVEHNRGHHRRVATPDDPASARRGETVYGFWVRSVLGGVRSAWHLEADRVAREGRPWWTNALVGYGAVQGAALALVGLLAGPAALLGWIVAATIGFLLLETVNYVEHYGLQRRRTETGAYERVRSHHSWNSNRPGGRVFLFELTRHADHHAHATRKYQVLRHDDDAPMLPAGYPAMIVLALFPPLFFAVMHRAIDRWSAHGAGTVPAK
jgi:alkane 1-monooxygenase